MIAIDTNLLVYAHREDSEWHSKAIRVLTDLAQSGQPWGIPWPCVHEFISITTHPKIYVPPTPLSIALETIDCWLNIPTCHMLSEGPGYFAHLSTIATKAMLKGPMIHDARIAAICLSHGVKKLWTCDRDFSRFPSLRHENPL